MSQESTKQEDQLSFLAPDKAAREAAQRRILEIIEENVALMREIAALYGSPQIKEERRQIKGPADAAALLSPEMAGLDQEQVRVIVVNTKNEVLTVEMVYQGSLNATMVRTAELFKEAVRRNGAAVILAHNHPSSSLEPSPEDLLVTQEAAEAGELLGIDLLDHVIIGGGGYKSLKESHGELWE